MGSVNFDFDDEVVIVTGGSSGIGRSISLAFGEAGATVFNADIRSIQRIKLLNDRLTSASTNLAVMESTLKPTSLILR